MKRTRFWQCWSGWIRWDINWVYLF